MGKKNLNVLLIEDDASSAFLVQEVLKETPSAVYAFHIEHVERLAAGLERIARGGIDMVLLDLGLPDSFGMETLRAVSAQYPRLPVVVLTGEDDDAVGIEAVKSGAQDYLIKGTVSGPLLVRSIAHAVERMQVLLSMRESEERFRAVMASAPDAIITIDFAGRILFWNAGAEKIFGYAASETLGRTPEFLIPHRLLQREYRELEHLLREGTSPLLGSVVEGSALRRDGVEIPTELSLARWESGGQFFFSAIIRDLSEKKRLQEEASRTSRLASIGELAAGVAHEINNPVNGIINYAQLMVDACEKTGGDDGFPREIIKEGRRIATIVKNLLTFALDTNDTPMPFELSKICDASLMLISKQLQKNYIKASVRIPGDLPLVMVQPQQIQQVFVNILSNARQALNLRYPGVHENKMLEVSAGVLAGDGGACVQTVFLDHGTGIAKNDLPRVCEPFFSGPFRRMGLGLTICHNIIQAHGGRLHIESREGEYTKVTVELPCA